MTSTAPQTSPRGTERVRRRNTQAAHAEVAKQEGANLTSPGGPEKEAQIKKLAEAQIARFGPTSKTRREGQQAEHRKIAVRQESNLPSAEITTPQLVAGEQVSLVTANRLARIHDREERDLTNDAARAAAVAVRDTLRGAVPQDGPEARFKHITQHNARADATAAAAAAAVQNAK